MRNVNGFILPVRVASAVSLLMKPMIFLNNMDHAKEISVKSYIQNVCQIIVRMMCTNSVCVCQYSIWCVRMVWDVCHYNMRDV